MMQVILFTKIIINIKIQLYFPKIYYVMTWLPLPLLKDYLNVTQMLLKCYSNVTQTLFKHYSNATQTILECYSNVTQMLLKRY